IWQFVIKGSAGGLWYYFGERTFSISTIGISSVNLDQQILRPYGAFPHPNVLAFFLLLNIVFSFHQVKVEKGLWKYILMVSFLVSCAVVVLTFSRIAIILLVAFFIFEIYTKVKKKVRLF